MRLSFVTEFEHYLLTKEKLQSNTSFKYIKNLKKVMRMCVDLDWIPSNPFDAFKCSYKDPKRILLTESEIENLINTQIEIPRLAEIRDVFVFCCYTGFAYSEVHSLSRNDLNIGMDGEYWITKYRKKTGERESVPLLPVALEIVNRYENHRRCKNSRKLLPVICNQLFNAYLKEIAIICRIQKSLTTHMARHTFATTITLSNGVPIETVSKMLGHSKISTTQIYAKVLDTKVSADMKQLKSKLEQNTKELNIEKSKVG
jgi:site-specific recombinase XerD